MAKSSLPAAAHLWRTDVQPPLSLPAVKLPAQHSLWEVTSVWTPVLPAACAHIAHRVQSRRQHGLHDVLARVEAVDAICRDIGLGGLQVFRQPLNCGAQLVMEVPSRRGRSPIAAWAWLGRGDSSAGRHRRYRRHRDHKRQQHGCSRALAQSGDAMAACNAQRRDLSGAVSGIIERNPSGRKGAVTTRPPPRGGGRECAIAGTQRTRRVKVPDASRRVTMRCACAAAGCVLLAALSWRVALRCRRPGVARTLPVHPLVRSSVHPGSCAYTVLLSPPPIRRRGTPEPGGWNCKSAIASKGCLNRKPARRRLALDNPSASREPTTGSGGQPTRNRQLRPVEFPDSTRTCRSSEAVTDVWGSVSKVRALPASQPLSVPAEAGRLFRPQPRNALIRPDRRRPWPLAAARLQAGARGPKPPRSEPSANSDRPTPARQKRPGGIDAHSEANHG
eukprot:364682-Chlamydomonas_euryale.AAC.18